MMGIIRGRRSSLRGVRDEEEVGGRDGDWSVAMGGAT